MSTDLVALPVPRSPGRPGPVRLVATLTGSGLRSFVRSPVAAFFTVGMPLLFLIFIGALFGNEVIEPRNGVRTAQFFTPALAAFGAAQAAFCVLASDTALMRERGVFRRLGGTPAPAWAVLAGRICSAVVVAGLTVALVIALGVAAYDVQILWRTAPAALVTLLVGVASFAALGLAVAAVVRSAPAVQALTNGLLVSAAFISDVFTVGGRMPGWLDRLAWFLPLKHFANPLSDAFNPYLAGNGFAAGHLAFLAGWGLIGALVAIRLFRMEPRAASTGRAAAVAVPANRGLGITTPGRPGPGRSLHTQIRYALTDLRRDASSVFFAVIFPVLLLALFPVLMAGGAEREQAAALMLPAMMAYGVAVIAFVTLPAPIAQARERGVLARLAGTPMPRWAYAAGRVCAALVAATATALGLLLVAALGFGVPLDAARLPAAAVTFLLGILCFAALGFAVLALVRNAQTVIAVTLGTLLPLCFISDVFVIGARMPQPLAAIADVLPLKHAVHAFRAALEPGLGGTGFAWADLAVLLAWTAAAILVTRRVSWR